MSDSTLIVDPLTKIGRAELTRIPVPPSTPTHKPVPHHEIVEALIETLGFRHIGVVEEEYAVSNDGMRMFGVLDLETQMEGCRFSIGLGQRNVRRIAPRFSSSMSETYGGRSGSHPLLSIQTSPQKWQRDSKP